MDNEIALIAVGYLVTRIGVLLAFAYLVYRLLRTQPKTVAFPSRSEYARERFISTQLER